MIFWAVASCRVASCLVASCRVASCRVASCRVVSRRVVSCRVVSRRVASPRAASRRVVSLVSCRFVSRRCASRRFVSLSRHVASRLVAVLCRVVLHRAASRRFVPRRGKQINAPNLTTPAEINVTNKRSVSCRVATRIKNETLKTIAVDGKNKQAFCKSRKQPLGEQRCRTTVEGKY